MTRHLAIVVLAIITITTAVVFAQQSGPMMQMMQMMHGPQAQPSVSNGLGFQNPNGYSLTVSQGGSMPGPFFMNFGTNGRNCATCHQASDAMSVSAANIQARFDATGGIDPLFRTNDGSNCNHDVDVTSVAARSVAYSLLRTRGLIRTALSVPKDADFEVVSVSNPYGCGEKDLLSVYRRPLPSTNLRFLSEVMWDGRESSSETGTAPITPTNYPESLTDDLGHQAGNLTDDLGHQAVSAAILHAQASFLPPPWRQHVVAFEMAQITAQSLATGAGPLDTQGALGGPVALSTQRFFIGINDPFGFNPSKTTFTPVIFDIFNAWAKIPDSDPRAAIVRGQTIFNSKLIAISGVAGLNDTFNLPSLQGTCGTCHDSPNVGNHSVALPLNIGVADLTNPNGVDYLPVFSLRNKNTKEVVQTTDPGRALVTGKFADIGKMKVPILRGLSARAPYFHNGSAMTLLDVVNFHDLRFRIGLTAQEKTDLVAFLGAL